MDNDYEEKEREKLEDEVCNEELYFMIIDFSVISIKLYVYPIVTVRL
jgi:hypothetical protein